MDLPVDADSEAVLEALMRRIQRTDRRSKDEILVDCLIRGLKAHYKDQSLSVGMESAVQGVFDFWVKTFEKSKARLTDPRKKKICARLREGYSDEDLRDAIAGAAQSEFHRKNGFTDIATILKSSVTVDQHIERQRGETMGNNAIPPSTAFYETPLHAIFHGPR